jgi:ribokinase
MARTIVVIGTVNVDNTLIVNSVPVPGESVKARDYKQSTGGKGANASIAAFRSSHKRVPADDGTNNHKYISAFLDSDDIQVRLVAVTGEDENGEFCRKSLQSSGIDISKIRMVSGQATSMCVCIVEYDSGQSRVIMSHGGANDSQEAREYISADLLTDGGHPDLLISQLGLPRDVVVEPILDAAGKAGIDILLNPAPARNILTDLYKYITHFIVNETQAATLSGRIVEDVKVETCPIIAKFFLKKGVKNVVIRLGEYGAYYARIDEHGAFQDGYVPAYHAAVVDATGAR